MMQLREFARHKTDFDQLDTRVAAISVDDVAHNHDVWEKVLGKQFVVLSDPGAAVIRQYGLLHSTGKGDADVISYTRKAEASALKAVVTPFGSGSAYARYLYLNKIAPNIDSVMSTSDGPLAEPFRELSKPEVKGGAK